MGPRLTNALCFFGSASDLCSLLGSLSHVRVHLLGNLLRVPDAPWELPVLPGSLGHFPQTFSWNIPFFFCLRFILSCALTQWEWSGLGGEREERNKMDSHLWPLVSTPVGRSGQLSAEVTKDSTGCCNRVTVGDTQALSPGPVGGL